MCDPCMGWDGEITKMVCEHEKMSNLTKVSKNQMENLELKSTII